MSDLFIITSVINTGNQPWSYTQTRSCFSKEERYQQTLLTIDSIHKYHAGAKIMLIDCSEIDDSMTDTLKGKVDYFIQTYDNNDIRNACLESTKKGFGEIMKIQKACDIIRRQGITFDTLFKLSGRYYLNSNFDRNNYRAPYFGFKMYSENSGSTVLYSVPYELFDIYQNKIDACADFYKANPPTGLETLLPNLCEPKIHVPTLGVSGNVAVCNDEGKSDYYQA